MKPAPEQQAAIDEVKGWLREQYAALDEKRQLHNDYELFFACAPRITIHGKKGVRLNPSDEELVRRATVDPNVWGIARQAATYKLAECQPLSPELSKFIAGVLSGANKKPKHKNRKGKDLRDPLIAEAVWRLVNADVGITYSRSPASPPNSASDVIAEILSTKEIGDPKSWDAVRKIYEEQIKLGLLDWLEYEQTALAEMAELNRKIEGYHEEMRKPNKADDVGD
ncbi:MAG TPA: hypothetical protein DHU56_03970 [Marinobacter sp.]|nr:hypothetical protein [Marinobacter sp.]